MNDAVAHLSFSPPFPAPPRMECEVLDPVENGRAVLRAVELGRTNGLEAEILAGIEVGDTVIEHPSESVEDGKAVRRRG